MFDSLYIIAEIGVNHNGRVDFAKRMIEEAANCGVQAVKFQVFNPMYLVTKKAKTADYQQDNTKIKTQQELLQKYTFSFEVIEELVEYTKQFNLDFLATPFDISSVNFLYPFVKYYKVSSGDFDNYHLLDAILFKNKGIILSTGMSDVKEIDDVLNFIDSKIDNLEKNVSIMHCVSNYPTALEDVNLKFIDFLKENYKGITIGFSDHTEGITAPLAAIARGVNLLEKHVTLSKDLEGPDHKASIDFDELKTLVTEAKKIQLALGDVSRVLGSQELNTKKKVRRSVCLNRDMKEGDIITSEDIITLRPADGIHPRFYTDIVGKKLKIDKVAYTLLQWEDFYG